MAVQAEFGESASESGIRQVEVEPTAPISDVSLLNVIFSCFSLGTHLLKEGKHLFDWYIC